MRRVGAGVAGGVLAVALTACGGGGASKASFCAAAANAVGKSALLGNALSDADTKALAEADALFKSMQRNAPSEIKADMNLLARYFDNLVAGFKAAGNDPVKKAAVLAPLLVEQTAIEQAGNHVRDYAKQQCGIVVPDSSSTGSTSAGASTTSDPSSSLSLDSSGLDSFLSSFSSQLSDLSSQSDAS